MNAMLQLGGAVAILLGLAGTWLAARTHAGWLVCLVSSALWLPALVVGSQWVAVVNVALSMAICLRNFWQQHRRALGEQGSWSVDAESAGRRERDEAPTVPARSV